MHKNEPVDGTQSFSYEWFSTPFGTEMEGNLENACFELNVFNPNVVTCLGNWLAKSKEENSAQQMNTSNLQITVIIICKNATQITTLDGHQMDQF